jgi:DNA polymerase bacteriophage-type
MLHLDYETRSELELGGKSGHGLHNYAVHPSTKILMLAWAIDDDDVNLWMPHEGPMPSELKQYMSDPDEECGAFNSPFERYISKYQLGIDIPVHRWQDPQASARYLSLPANLEDVGEVLGLPLELRKDKRGEQLLDIFSYPQTRKKKELKANPELSPIYFNDHISHPAEFKQLGEYCKQDIVTEKEVARRLRMLRVYPLPERERKIWLFDQKVNDRGMPTDKSFVQKAFDIADRNKQEKLEQQNKLTGLENANSADQLLPWVRKRGYPLNNLRKNNIELILKDSEVKLSDECRVVLNHRMEASSTSYKKLQTILRNISADGNLRNQFIYCGSSRCSRWAGNAVQLQNFARPDGTFEDMLNVLQAREYIIRFDYDGLKTAFKKSKVRPLEDEYYSPLIITKNIIRTVFVAPKGKRFNVCDLNAIETRVAAWVAECPGLLAVFAAGLDPYLAFAVKMTGIPYEKLLYDLKENPDKILRALAKSRRQIAKPGVLGAVYRLGPGGWRFDKNGDRIKTGLWGYAETMGVDMSQEQAQEVVKIFRESYPEICGNGYNQMKGIWVRLEEAVMDVLNGQKTIRKIGPNGCIVIDKLTIKDRDPILRIQVPSGGYLHYLDATVQNTKMPWQKKNFETGEMEDVHRPAFCYYGMDQDTKQWDMIVSHGGKVFENIVQKIAREVLAEKMLEFEEIGLETVGHFHDEGACLSNDDPFAPGLQEMVGIMNTPVKWAPTLPLGSDGFEDSFYHK